MYLHSHHSASRSVLQYILKRKWITSHFYNSEIVCIVTLLGYMCRHMVADPWSLTHVSHQHSSVLKLLYPKKASNPPSVVLQCLDLLFTHSLVRVTFASCCLSCHIPLTLSHLSTTGLMQSSLLTFLSFFFLLLLCMSVTMIEIGHTEFFWGHFKIPVRSLWSHFKVCLSLALLIHLYPCLNHCLSWCVC